MYEEKKVRFEKAKERREAAKSVVDRNIREVDRLGVKEYN